MKIASPTHKKNRGFALITALFFVVLLFILMGVMLDNLNNELVSTGMHGRSNAALRAAYLGVEEMQYQFELNDAGAAPGQTPPPQNKTYTDTDGTVVTYSVTVDAQQWNVTPPYYLIHAQGIAGTSTRNVDALLQKQPYSAFSLFTISEQNNVGGVVWYAQGENFDGPVYSGGPMRIFYQSGASPPPIFSQTVTTAANPVWAPSAPSSGADWAAIISNQSNFKQVSQALTLPAAADNSAVQDAAFTGNPKPASTPAFPAATGLYINGANVNLGGGGAVNSGMYIVGDAFVTSAGVAGTSETFTFQINPTSCAPIASCLGPMQTYHVIIDFMGNTTTVKDGSNTTIASYTGVPSGQQPFGVTGQNGAIWATQGMWLNAGNTFAGKYALAVPDAQGLSNPNLYIAGSEQYADPANDALAYWANDIVLWDTISANIEVDGLILTGYYGECSVVCNNGTFSNHFCTAVPLCGGGTGVLTLRGTLVENVRGKRGTLGTLSGFSTDVVFDPRLARTPPPFTPSTTQFNVVALCTVDVGKTCGQ